MVGGKRIKRVVEGLMDFDELTGKVEEDVIVDKNISKKRLRIKVPQDFNDRIERSYFLEEMKQQHINFHTGFRVKLNDKLNQICECYYCEREIPVEMPKKKEKLEKKEERRKDIQLITNGFLEQKEKEKKERKPIFDLSKLMFWKKKKKVRAKK